MVISSAMIIDNGKKNWLIFKTRVRAYGMLDGVVKISICFFFVDFSCEKESVRSFIPKFHELFLSHHFIHKKKIHSLSLSLSLSFSSLCHFLSDSYYFSMQIVLSMNLSTLTSLLFSIPLPFGAHLWERWAFRCIFSCLLHSNHGAEHCSLLLLETFHNLRGWIEKWRKWFYNIRKSRLMILIDQLSNSKYFIKHPSFPNVPPFLP